MIADLGKSIGSILKNLTDGPATDEAIEKSLREICAHLIRHNVNPTYVATLRDNIRAAAATAAEQAGPSGRSLNRGRLVQKAVYSELVRLLSPGEKPFVPVRGRTSVVVFVGLQGSGKTTSICKYANYHKRKGFKVGIVCADTFRAGAYDQVKQNATKIGVPFYGSASPDPVQVAREGVVKFRRADFELILVDTSGRHVQEEALFEEMRGVVEAVGPDNIVFVMDAGMGQSAEEQAKGFKGAVPVGSVMLTKVDGAERAGGAISSVAATGCPIDFIGTGEGMEDLELFDAKRFVSRLLGMGDIEGLVEAVSSLEIDKEAVVEKMVGGKMKLSDFKQLYNQLLALGPLSKMMGMIPGMGDIPIPDESKFRTISYIFDSLSRSELDSNGDMLLREPSRIKRIAYGCGCGEEAVREMINNFRTMSGVMKKMMGNPMMQQMLGGGWGGF